MSRIRSSTCTGGRAGDAHGWGVGSGSRQVHGRATIIPQLLASSAGMSPDAIADRIKAAVSSVDDRRTDDVAILVMRCLE